MKAVQKIKDTSKNIFSWIGSNPGKASILFAFMLLSLFLKVHEVKTGLGDEFQGSDPFAYHQYAADIVQHGKYSANPFNPLEIIYLTAVYFVFGVNQVTARFIQILFSFFISFFLYKVTKKYFGETAGFIAALLAMVEPNIVYYSAHLWTEFWVVFCLSFLMYLFVENMDRDRVKKGVFFLMGILSAIGAFGKLWVCAAGIVLMLFLVYYVNRKKISALFLRIDNYLYLAFFALGLVLIILPWSLFSTHVAGYRVIINTNSNLNFYLGNNPKGDIAMTSIYDYSYADNTIVKEGVCKDLIYNNSDKLWMYYLSECIGKYSKNYIMENPGKFVNKLYLFTTKFWLFPNLEWYQRNVRTPKLRLFVLWTFFILAVVGFLISLQKFWEFIPYYLILLGIWLSYAVTVFLGRYKASNAPFTVIFAAGGIYTIWYLFMGKGKKK